MKVQRLGRASNSKFPFRSFPLCVLCVVACCFASTGCRKPQKEAFKHTEESLQVWRMLSSRQLLYYIDSYCQSSSRVATLCITRK